MQLFPTPESPILSILTRFTSGILAFWTRLRMSSIAFQAKIRFDQSCVFIIILNIIHLFVWGTNGSMYCFHLIRMRMYNCLLSGWISISSFLKLFNSSLISTFICWVKFLNVALASGFRLYSDFLNVGKTSTVSAKNKIFFSSKTSAEGLSLILFSKVSSKMERFKASWTTIRFGDAPFPDLVNHFTYE